MTALFHELDTVVLLGDLPEARAHVRRTLDALAARVHASAA